MKTMLICAAGAASLLLAGSAMAADYNPAASAQAAHTWKAQEAMLTSQDEAKTLASQEATNAAASGERVDVDVVANQPVPDTAANRARFGQPDSASGRLTRPIGD